MAGEAATIERTTMRIRCAFVLAATLLACAAGAASASPTELAFFECAKFKGGGFANKTCSEAPASEGKGKFEVKEGTGKSKLIAGKINNTLIAAEHLEVGCEKSRMTGELTSPTTFGKVHLELTNCGEGRGPNCGATVGHHRGVIEIGPLAGPLGMIAKGNGTIGVMLSPESGTTLAEFTCGPAGPPTYRLKGALMGTIGGNVEQFSKTFDVTTSGGQSFEGGEPVKPEVEKIATGESEPIGLLGSPWVVTTKSYLEIKT